MSSYKMALGAATTAPEIDGVNEDTESKDGFLIDNDAQEREAVKYKEAAKTLPETRQRRIEELRGLIESGQYHVDSRRIAEKILNRQLEDDPF